MSSPNGSWYGVWSSGLRRLSCVSWCRARYSWVGTGRPLDRAADGHQERVDVGRREARAPLVVAPIYRDRLLCPFVEGQLAESTVREQFDSYIEYESPQDMVGTKRRLDKPLPELQLSTQSLMLTLPISITQGVATPESEALLSGLHTLEYALTSLLPLELLCDRGDLGGLSTSHHPATGTSTIFVHDVHPGGVGLAQSGYERIESLLAETQSLLQSCSCTGGCPSCVQSPQCGNANKQLDKHRALNLLSQLVAEPVR